MARLDRVMAELERRTVRNARGEVVGMRNPARPGGLGGIALAVVEILLMRTVGGTAIGRYPLSERLLAATVAVLVLSFVFGALARFVAIARGLRRGPRLQRAGPVLLNTSLAAFLAVVLVLGVNTVLPLHLDGWIRG